MRLKLEFACNKLKLPISYQSLLQGLIYSIFDKEEYGYFLHDEGYKLNHKVFKMFNFSNLFGKYNIEDKNVIFDNEVRLYIASQSEEFIQIVYQFFIKNERVVLNHQFLNIKNIELIDTPYFKGEKDIVIKTLSPIVAYKTIDKYVNFYKPSDEQFFSLCLSNLNEKCKALDEPIRQLVFNINSVNFEKKRIVQFKNTFYIAYLAELNVHINYETLDLLYNTGLSAKGSAGFGMIEAKL